MTISACPAAAASLGTLSQKRTKKGTPTQCISRGFHPLDVWTVVLSNSPWTASRRSRFRMGFLPISAAASIYSCITAIRHRVSLSLSGHAITYRWRSLPRVRRHGASKYQGCSERVLPWQVTMNQLRCASLSYIHYWYEVRMLNFPVSRLHLLLCRFSSSTPFRSSTQCNKLSCNSSLSCLLSLFCLVSLHGD